MVKICPAILILSSFVVFIVTLPTQNQTDNNSASMMSRNKRDKILKKKYCFSSKNVSSIINEIMGNSEYDIHTIPTFETGKPLEIKIALTVLVFRDVKEVDMTYTVDFFLRTTWVDKRLRNSLDCILTMTMGKKHPAEVIWVPDTMIENSVTSNLHEVLTNNHKIDISPEGEVFWSTRVTSNAMCHMDLVKFPLDKQTCSLLLLSYAYTTDLVHYVWDEVPVGVMDKTLSQFDVTSFSHDSYLLTYAAGEYSILKAIFVFERRFGYYFIQVYIPCFFLVVLAGFSFWVDFKAIPARVALSLTTLLIITTLWSGTNSNLPPVTYVKAVDIYFLTSFGFVLLTLLEYILVLNYVFVKGVIKHKCRFCRLTKRKTKTEKGCIEKHWMALKRRNKPPPKGSDGEIEMSGILENNKANCNMENKTKNKENDEAIVSRIDKITKCIYPIAYILFNVVYWFQLKY